MKHTILPCLLTSVALVTGCIPLSLHPLYTEETHSFEPKLVGAWVGPEGDADTTDGWFFASEDNSTYKLVIREDGTASPMQARLVHIGESRFLDLYPDKVELGDATQPGLKLGDYYRLQLLSLHTFVRIDSVEPELRITPAHFKSLERIILEQPEVIAHQRIPNDEWFFFTAPPRDLQEFVATFEKELFDSGVAEQIVLKPLPARSPVSE